MKIALVILHADPARGGAERYTVDLADALAKNGHSVSMLASTFAPLPQGVTQVSLPAAGMTRKGQYLNFLDSLDAHLDRTKYDIVHAMLPVRRCDFYHPHAGLAVMPDRRGPITALFNPRRSAMATIERRLLGASHPPRVLCLSQYVKLAFKRFYPLNDAHLPVLFNAVDTTKFDPNAGAKTPHEKIIALMIAQDFERKGLAATIEALARIDDKNLILRVVGKEDTSKYQRLAAGLKVADRIQFAGPTSDPASEYRNADFFVLPTRHDPCSLVVLEALAMGLPVISTRLNGACEIMTEGVHGFVLSDPADIASLAKAMQKMMDPGMRSHMSAACLELRANLSYQHHLDRLLQFYQAVQSARPRRIAMKGLFDV
ncbi:MAG TPA: glycosyltransferase family 4 protein [Tepidisphaeraceae bacterium]|nr:glycosyltransferase family 4 protein [Tepidisphaeraceae bacterium]